MEEEFERIANKAIEDAEAVDCELSEFVEGLETIVLMLQERLEQAHDEHGDDE